MIKVAITGADTKKAGEIIRILANHPEVELTTLSAPGKEGQRVSEHHHGLIGKEDYRFSGPLGMDPESDVIFVCGNSLSSAEFTALQHTRPDIRIIQVDALPNVDMERAGVVAGISEINRKALVRGAVCSRVLSPLAVAALVPLYPLALNMLLNSSLKIKAVAPKDIVDNELEEAKKDISAELHSAQMSFDQKPEIECAVTENERFLEMEITMDCNVSLDQLMQIYEIYDDHHLSFAVTGDFSPLETEGTPKLVFSVSKPEDDKLKLLVRLDPCMRGGASEAVHNMNLMFALHETTGLEIKASRY